MVAGLFAPLLLMDMFEFPRILPGNEFWTISCLLYGFAVWNQINLSIRVYMVKKVYRQVLPQMNHFPMGEFLIFSFIKP